MGRVRVLTKNFGFLLLGLLPLRVALETVQGASAVLTIQEDHEQADLTLVLTAAAEYQSEMSDQELYFKFDQAIHLTEPASSISKRSQWIESVSQGYDSLLIRMSKPCRFSVRQNGPLLMVRMRRLEGVIEEIHPLARYQLDLLGAQLLIDLARFPEAAEELERLQMTYDDRAEIIASIAALEESVARHRTAKLKYRQALTLDPENEDYQMALEDLELPDRPTLEMTAGGKRVTDAQSEFRTRLRAESEVLDGLRSGFSFARNEIEVHGIRMEDGTLDDFAGTRHQGEIFLSYDRHSGDQLKASLLSNGSRAGFGFSYRRPDYTGGWELQADYRRANWDFVEGVVNGVTRDRLSLRRLYRFDGRLRVFGTVSANRYSTRCGDSAAKSVGWEGSLSYRIRKQPLFLEYGIEAEYRTSILSQVDPESGNFYPVPLISREVHFLNLAFSRQLLGKCDLESYGGLSVDRLGATGPFAAATVKCEPRRGPGIHAWFDHRLNSTDTSQTVLFFGGTVLWRF